MKKKRNTFPIGLKVEVTSNCKYLDSINHIYDEIYSRRKYITILGRELKFYDRSFTVRNKIDKDNIKVGFNNEVSG